MEELIFHPCVCDFFYINCVCVILTIDTCFLETWLVSSNYVSDEYVISC
jgi:hypothetical protein